MTVRINRAVLFFLTLTAVFASGAGFTKALSLEQMSTVLAILGSLTAWYVTFMLEDKNLASFPLLFATLFVLYTLSPTLEALLFGIDGLSSFRELESILWGREVDLSFIAILSNVALLGFVIGLLKSYHAVGALDVMRNYTQPFCQQQRLSRAYTWFYPLGIAAFLMGVVLSLLDLYRVGGLQAIFTPRLERLSALAENTGSLPSSPFIFSGLAVAIVGWIHGGRKKLHGLLLLALVGLWFVYLFIQGDRRFVFYALLIGVGVVTFDRGFSFRITLKNVLVLALLFFIFSAFGAVRWMIPPLLRGAMSPGEARTWLIENFSWSWFLPSSNEFIGPYTTLIITSSDPNWQSLVGAPLLGSSYLYALPNLLPRSLYPGEKWESLSFRFSNYVYATYLPPDIPAPIGFGFSPLAEACLNFGLNVWSPFALFLLWGWFFGKLRLWARKKPSASGTVIYALLLPQAFNLNRIDFVWAFQEAVYFVFAGVLLLVLAYVLDLSTHRAKRLSSG